MKKEGEEIKFGTLPRNAAEYQPWMNNAVDAIAACARNARDAFAWVTRVEQDNCEFEELGIEDVSKESLDAKIRVAMSKHMQSTEAEKNKELVSALEDRRDKLKM